MSIPLSFEAMAPGARLADRVADALLAQIDGGGLQPGHKLPTEAALAQQFNVSRTVIREAVARLKSLGRVSSRQGSGIYVQAVGIPPLSFDAGVAVSREAVVQMVELRRALEAEVAGLAAQRRKPADLRRIRQAIAALDKAVRSGGDGVQEDDAFHRSIAEAARNPFLLDTLQYLGRFLTVAKRITRANEARRVDFAQQVREEHARIVQAIEAADTAAARLAASGHMDNAIHRIELADPAFWQQEGELLARALVSRLEPRAN